MQMRRVFDWLRDGPRLDMAWLQVGPLNEKGRYPFAPSVDFAVGALANVDTVLVELNAQVRASMLMPSLPPQRIDGFLRSDRPLLTAPVSRVDAASSAIGAQVAALIRDGDCIQTGIGAIPAAVLAALQNKNDLGMHSGLLDAAGGELIRRGVMNGRRKTLDQGMHVTGMALGDAAFYEWVAGVENIAFRPASHTHEISALRQIDNFVSINSAVEVDLFGQVNAEIVGGRQYSGTGGSVDFMRGAAASKGGRSIVALLATARDGQVSRIVPALDRGVAATAARTDVDYVVTEYGVVRLFGLDLDARAEALTSIAAPTFRDGLREQWQRLRHGG
jgi:4-hydroxybutyrate CoA-transferase